MWLFDLDRWREVFGTHLQNRFRSTVTGLSVAWGIFMLVLLMGAGRGLENNLAYQFRDDAVNSIWLYSGLTSRPYRGHPKGRSIEFDNRDYEAIAAIPGVEHSTGRYYLQGEFTIRYRDRVSAFSVRSCHPGHRYLEKTLITKGRFLNELDLSERRKVTVIGQKVAEFLFPGEDPLGAWIDISGISYRVVGVFEDAGGEGEMRQVYIPISTAQAAYGGGSRVHQIMFTTGDASIEQVASLTEEVRTILAARHNFDVADRGAVRVRNNLERFQQIQQVFTYLRSFIWLVGAGTITAGVVGVGNIMLVSVRERTREIGLRKALGATPGSIVGQIVQEAVTLTALAGYAGLLVGIALIETTARFMPENDYLRDPSVELSTVLIATGVLVVAGALAGWFPARRAAAVSPIVALRDE